MGRDKAGDVDADGGEFGFSCRALLDRLPASSRFLDSRAILRIVLFRSG